MCGGLELGRLGPNSQKLEAAAESRPTEEEPEGGGARAHPSAEHSRSAPSRSHRARASGAKHPLARTVGPVARLWKERGHRAAN